MKDDWRNSYVTEFAILLAVLLPIARSRADSFTTAANQFFGMPPQTWNDGIWQPGPVPPTADHTYEVLGRGLIRNPTDSATETFPGDSLMLDAGSRLRVTGWSAITVNFPGTGGNPGLILNGGRLQAAVGASDQAITIAGQISVVADSAIDQRWRPRPFIVTAQISGSNNLTLVGGSLQNPLDVQSANNPYTGNWFVRRGALKGTGNGSLGAGNITIADGASFEVDYDVQSPGTLTLFGSNGMMVLHQNCQFGAVTINGVTLTPGTYSYDALVALFPGNFADGGSGSITVPAPSTSANDPTTLDDRTGDDLSSSDSPATPDSSDSSSVTDGGSDPVASPISLSANLAIPLITDTTAPAISSAVIVSVDSPSQITVSWNKSTDTGGSGLGGYRVYRNGTLVGTTTGTSYVDTGLSPSTRYCYTIATYDNAGNISSSSALSCATTAALPDTIAPTVPVGTIASANSSSQITVSWNASTDTGSSGLAGYEVYRSGIYVNAITATSFVDTGLSPDTQYCYAILAYDNAGNISSASPLVCATTPPAPPKQLTLSWAYDMNPDPGNAPTGFVFLRGTNSSPAIIVGSTSDGPRTNWVDTSPIIGVTNYYQIVAYNSAGTSSYSNVASGLPH